VRVNKKHEKKTNVIEKVNDYKLDRG